ncbi:ATP-binding protein [Nocardioides nitrophenolicus]|uniref:ATP-binding protein n=1 Tax=Nocardioides nitrophenolicus TaxID=60489 RepID=UPI0019589B63|nr:ATP-binding protein [Nocardioides nitrophenolicus]MBM7518094.1 hypothetical protein [Nocardioides nitrophenolicus]
MSASARDSLDSPYQPGFGARPVVLVGRDQQLGRAAATLTRVANSGTSAPSAMVLTGARGLGKTVTLGVIGDDALARRFVTVAVTLDRVSDNVQLLAGGLAEAIAPLEVDAQRGVGEMWKRFRDRLGTLAIEVNAGVVKVSATADPVARRTTTPDVVMAAASFTERFDYRDLGRLDDGAAARALLEPSLGLGVTWAESAAVAVIREAGGSPYLIQYLGDETWLHAQPGAGSRVEPAHARAGIDDVRRSLATGMFRGRWNKATPAERLLLIALAQVMAPDGVATSRHVTALLDRTTPQLSTARKSLIDKGIIESAGTGLLRFTIQGFAEFVREHVDAPWYGARLAAGEQVDLTAVRRPELPAVGAGREARMVATRDRSAGSH